MARPLGDIGYYDDEGRIHYVDRSKEMIRCMDNQVAPGELEDLLIKGLNGIDEVVVVGVPHPHFGQAPAAVIVLKDTHKGPGVVTEEEIKAIITSEYALERPNCSRASPPAEINYFRC